jgi:cyclopropane fatty-acyl-phospholipid synthase-like methyltransferase
MSDEIFTLAEASEHQFSVKLAELVAEFFSPEEPVIDFGCGNAGYLVYLQGRGFNSIGVEGTHGLTYHTPKRHPLKPGNPENAQPSLELVQWDLQHPLWLGVKGNVMSVEVGEHLHAQHHDAFMDNLSRHCTGKLLLTWAVPGQGGLRHVSERTQEQMVPYVARWGFGFLEAESRRWRAVVAEELGYFRMSIYLFERG